MGEIIGKLPVADKLYEYTVSRRCGKQAAHRVVKMPKRLLTCVADRLRRHIVARRCGIARD
ncbi:hypothetical protein [Caballeronia novacaledonica]|uniref:hypothetical protein n=1 Tax=Caballeronia novacaledonica TaxID=1544861 RepID=UPI0011B291A2|nr:hypothetical protein [Caballeronia novacaledonica]